MSTGERLSFACREALRATEQYDSVAARAARAALGDPERFASDAANATEGTMSTQAAEALSTLLTIVEHHRAAEYFERRIAVAEQHLGSHAWTQSDRLEHLANCTALASLRRALEVDWLSS